MVTNKDMEEGRLVVTIDSADVVSGLRECIKMLGVEKFLHHPAPKGLFGDIFPGAENTKIRNLLLRVFEMKAFARIWESGETDLDAICVALKNTLMDEDSLSEDRAEMCLVWVCGALEKRTPKFTCEQQVMEKTTAPCSRMAAEPRPTGDPVRKKQSARQEILDEAARDFDFSGRTLTKFRSSAAVYTVPSFITSIASGAFRDCQSIRHLTLPNSITDIGGAAFRGCSNLESIELPDSLAVIKGCLFAECGSLRSIRIPSKVTRIEDEAFRDCVKLGKIVFPDAVEETRYTHYFGSEVFKNCTSLTEIKIPEGVGYVSSGLFEGCSGLTKIDLPHTVWNIGGRAFSACKKLETVRFPRNRLEIGGGAFRECVSLEQVFLAEPLRIIESEAFEGCRELRSIGNPDDMDMPFCKGTIYGHAFANCTKLETITLGGECTPVVHKHAFFMCENLTINYTGKLAAFMKHYGRMIGARKVVCEDRSCELEPDSEKIECRQKNRTELRFVVFRALAMLALVVCGLLFGTVVDWICGAVLAVLWLNVMVRKGDLQKTRDWLSFLFLLTNVGLLIGCNQSYRFVAILPAVVCWFISCIGCYTVFKEDMDEYTVVVGGIFVAANGAACAIAVIAVVGVTNVLGSILYILGSVALDWLVFLACGIGHLKYRPWYRRKYGKRLKGVPLWVRTALVYLAPLLLYVVLAVIFPSFRPFFGKRT